MNYVYKNVIENNIVFSYGAAIPGATKSTVCSEMDSRWITICYADLTKQTENLQNNNSFVISDCTFDIVGANNSKSIELSKNGFVVTANNNESEWFNSSRTFPGIVFDVAQLFVEKNDVLNNPELFNIRFIAQIYGDNETEAFEQTCCGIELKNKLPENNHIAYFLRSSDGKGNLFHGLQATTKNETVDFATDYSNKNLSVIVFEITNRNSVSVFTYTPITYDSDFSINELDGCDFVANALWSKCEEETRPFERYSDFNFCFGLTTSNKNRKSSSFLIRLIVQVQSK